MSSCQVVLPNHRQHDIGIRHSQELLTPYPPLLFSGHVFQVNYRASKTKQKGFLFVYSLPDEVWGNYSFMLIPFFKPLQVSAIGTFTKGAHWWKK